ncbi:hypothetical protein L7F22_045683 [Adiantum nelumboides]|nr:hypothetical protein [Adiantum nelumboides]
MEVLMQSHSKETMMEDVVQCLKSQLASQVHLLNDQESETAWLLEELETSCSTREVLMVKSLNKAENKLQQADQRFKKKIQKLNKVLKEKLEKVSSLLEKNYDLERDLLASMEVIETQKEKICTKSKITAAKEVSLKDFKWKFDSLTCTTVHSCLAISRPEARDFSKELNQLDERWKSIINALREVALSVLQVEFASNVCEIDATGDVSSFGGSWPHKLQSKLIQLKQFVKSLVQENRQNDNALTNIAKTVENLQSNLQEMVAKGKGTRELISSLQMTPMNVQMVVNKFKGTNQHLSISNLHIEMESSKSALGKACLQEDDSSMLKFKKATLLIELVESSDLFVKKELCMGGELQDVKDKVKYGGRGKQTKATTNKSKDAFATLVLMQEQGILPDFATYVSIFKACGRSAALEAGRTLHSQTCNLLLDDRCDLSWRHPEPNSKKQRTKIELNRRHSRLSQCNIRFRRDARVLSVHRLKDSHNARNTKLDHQFEWISDDESMDEWLQEAVTQPNNTDLELLNGPRRAMKRPGRGQGRSGLGSRPRPTLGSALNLNVQIQPYELRFQIRKGQATNQKSMEEGGRTGEKEYWMGRMSNGYQDGMFRENALVRGHLGERRKRMAGRTRSCEQIVGWMESYTRLCQGNLASLKQSKGREPWEPKVSREGGVEPQDQEQSDISGQDQKFDMATKQSLDTYFNEDDDDEEYSSEEDDYGEESNELNDNSDDSDVEVSSLFLEEEKDQKQATLCLMEIEDTSSL